MVSKPNKMTKKSIKVVMKIPYRTSNTRIKLIKLKDS